MKYTGLFVIAALAIAGSAVFAQDLPSTFGAQTRPEEAQRAKESYHLKGMALPAAKMARLDSLYRDCKAKVVNKAGVQRNGRYDGPAALLGTYPAAKAQMLAGAMKKHETGDHAWKHDCPYLKGMPQSNQQEHGKAYMHHKMHGQYCQPNAG